MPDTLWCVPSQTTHILPHLIPVLTIFMSLGPYTEGWFLSLDRSRATGNIGTAWWRMKLAASLLSLCCANSFLCCLCCLSSPTGDWWRLALHCTSNYAPFQGLFVHSYNSHSHSSLTGPLTFPGSLLLVTRFPYISITPVLVFFLIP
jgi:hypothetical protein